MNRSTTGTAVRRRLRLSGRRVRLLVLLRVFGVQFVAAFKRAFVDASDGTEQVANDYSPRAID